MSWEGDQSCGRQLQVEILSQHLSLTAISVVALSMESCIVRIKVTAVSFFEDNVLFSCRSANEWFPPWILASAVRCKNWDWGSAAKIYLHMASEQARTGGVKLQSIGECSLGDTCLEEFSTLWNEYFLLHLAFITQILPSTPNAFMLCEGGRVEKGQLCIK